ncbi:DUF1842 domain-containing protein [Caulobacter soli]|uniref:DUF1842 domain-containing protein n=1 Tax=Caulobacter soli TaxID=2708539 RepID=UPI0013E9FEB8|nr:DUF1842 domain-containing protein [Caulobacter soli]
MADDIGTLHTQKAADDAVGLYFVKAVVGKVGTPGAPIVNLALTVQAASGHVSGIAEISQAIDRGQHRFPVSGQIYQTGFGPNHQLVSLSGEFVYSVPPPAIGSFLAKFTAALSVDKSWNGSGGFNYLNTHVENVPVKHIA